MSGVAAKHLSLIVTAVVLAGAPALAQTPQERAWCEGEDAVSVDQRIDGCSAVIKAARDRGDILKTTQFDAAVSDYDAALRANPKFAFALYGRGLARVRNDDPSGEGDIAAAKALQADIAEEYARYGMPEAR